MLTSAKQKVLDRIYAVIRKRDIIRSGMLDNNDNFQPWASVFMREMGKFCYVARTTTRVSRRSGMIDSHASAVAEGRREVYLRMLELLRFSDEKALKMIEQLNQQED